MKWATFRKQKRFVALFRREDLSVELEARGAVVGANMVAQSWKKWKINDG
jgi:hypothetical protein